MSDVTIFHNPRCKKSREGLEHLQDAGVEPTIRKYLDEPLTADELRGLLAKIGAGPRDVIRKQEKVFRELGLKDPAKTDDELIEAMVANPKLIGRPIVVRGDKAVLALPHDKIDELL